MKKFYAIIAGAFLFGTTASAQRMVDLEATLMSPATGSTITAGTTFNMTAIIKNVGTTVIPVTDTLTYRFAIDTTILTFTSGSQTYNTYIDNQLLNPNDTIMLSMNFTVNFPASLNGNHNFCVLAGVRNRSSDSVKDNSLTNNISCQSVTFSGGGPNSVEGISATTNNNFVKGVFPVPATNVANFEVKLGVNSNVTVKITDLLGRTVVTENKGSMNKGTHTVQVQTANLPQGLYLYQVIMNEEVSSGKILINN